MWGGSNRSKKGKGEGPERFSHRGALAEAGTCRENATLSEGGRIFLHNVPERPAPKPQKGRPGTFKMTMGGATEGSQPQSIRDGSRRVRRKIKFQSRHRAEESRRKEGGGMSAT